MASYGGTEARSSDASARRQRRAEAGKGQGTMPWVLIPLALPVAYTVYALVMAARARGEPRNSDKKQRR
jgi:hypothetical protein